MPIQRGRHCPGNVGSVVKNENVDFTKTCARSVYIGFVAIVVGWTYVVGSLAYFEYVFESELIYRYTTFTAAM